MGEWQLTQVSVAGAPAVTFCVDPAAADPVAGWFLQHDWIDEPVQRAFVALVQPGMRVLDLGCHLGTFSLPAAALGAQVLAVDATAAHVELLNAAAEHNGFGHQLLARQRAISDSGEPVAFVERSIHGHVSLAGEERDGAAVCYVEPATVDALLAERGWDAVELIKMDIEGMETVALAGMRELFATGARPPVVFECNASTLPPSGSSICELRGQFEELGYELLMIDHLRPGVLVQSGGLTLQSECVCDYLALASRPAGLATGWRIEPPFSREQLTTRLLDTAAGEGGGYRAYAATLLAHGPAWLRESEAVAPALAALNSDLEAVVRDALAPAAAASAREHAGAIEPPSLGRPDDVVAWTRGLTVHRRSEELERAAGDEHADGRELLLSDVDLHVRAGQAVGVLSERAEAARALLRVLAGEQAGSGGRLERSAQALLVADVGAGMEPGLRVGENIALYGAFLGCAVEEAERRSQRVAEIAGLDGRLDARLGELDAASIAGLALSIALELTAPRLLLVGRLPRIASAPLRDWLAVRTWQLRQAGGAVVQVVEDEGELLGPPSRLLWIAGTQVACAGHPASVFEARRRALLGLPVAALAVGLA